MNDTINKLARMTDYLFDEAILSEVVATHAIWIYVESHREGVRLFDIGDFRDMLDS
jgi:hypothetical protein